VVYRYEWTLPLQTLNGGGHGGRIHGTWYTSQVWSGLQRWNIRKKYVRKIVLSGRSILSHVYGQF